MSDLPLPRVRQMGIVGTLSRACVGLCLTGDVVAGQLHGMSHFLPWLLGLAVVPGAVLAGHWLRVRRHVGRLQATGPIAHSGQLMLFVMMLLAPHFVSALWFTPDTVLLFYGSAMLVAAVRGQSDCEVLAVSNWVLNRDDRVGCVLFSPVDRFDQRRRAVSANRS